MLVRRLCLAILFVTGCGGDGGADGGPSRDGGALDAARADAGRSLDAGADAGTADAGGDGGSVDAGRRWLDASRPDSAWLDAAMCTPRYAMCDMAASTCCPGTLCGPAPPPLGAACHCSMFRCGDDVLFAPCCPGYECVPEPDGRGLCTAVP